MYAAVANTVSLFGVSLPSALIVPAFLFVITVVVFFHELGHFAVARYFGVKVDVFSIGFGREIVGFYDRKGTRWKFSWLPLGGYVKFSGDIDPSSRSDPEALKKMDSAARAGSLHFKPLYQRALVAAAGPLANFILAIVIFTVAFMISPQPVEPPMIANITKGSAAEAAGIQVGDSIRFIDGKPIVRFSDLQRAVTESAGRELRIGIERQGQPLEILATPRPTETKDAAGNKATVLLLGLGPRGEPLPFPKAFVRATVQTGTIIGVTFS